jgi:hypothetical protein
MKLKLSKINNEVVKPLPVIGEQDKRPVLGANLIPEVYSNVGIISKKNTGKTTIIGKILNNCVGKETQKVLLFASTAYKDSAYKTIRKQLEHKNVDVEVYTSIFENGQNVLDDLVHDLEQEAKQREVDEEKGIPQGPRVKDERTDVEKILDIISKENGINGYIDLEEEEAELNNNKKQRKSKFKMAEYVIVIDDLSNECRSQSLSTLLKKNRHFRVLTLVSVQWLADIHPQALRQLDVWIVMRGFNEKQLEKIYKDAQLSCPFETFVQIYQFATKEKYNFLYIDAKNMKFRKNFNLEINCINSDSDSEKTDQDN